MEDSVFQFSIGALIALGGIAVGYGTLKSTVNSLKETVNDLERVGVRRDKQIRWLELWVERRRGERNANNRQAPGIADTGIRKKDDDSYP